jgi:ATP-binding cassette subfamily C protein CydC
LNPVLKIVSLWRGRAAWLAFGAALSLGGLAAGAALMGSSGRYLAISLLGGAALVPLVLQITGSARVVLRYLERVFTHEATFRALADLRVWLFRGLARSAAGGLGFRRAGDSLARLVNDVDALDGLYLRILVPLPVLAARGTASAGARLAGNLSALRVTVLDAITGLREVRVFGGRGTHARRRAGAGGQSAGRPARRRQICAAGAARILPLRPGGDSGCLGRARRAGAGRGGGCLSDDRGF